MAFGQQSGYPASHGQVQRLSELVVAAGHADLRDARGALGLTQRQAGGKFTRDEADDLIARLEAEVEAPGGDVAGGAPVATEAVDDAAPDSAPDPVRALAARDAKRDAKKAATLHSVPAALLAAELQRRGWIVMEP